jgi:mannose-6-phosphate isomerase-like protein (cupin superfamily)
MPAFAFLRRLALAGVVAAAAAGAAPAEAPKRFEALGHKIEVKLDRAATNGTHAVLEVVDKPGFGPPRHVHTREDEIYYVVEGQVRIWRGGESFVVGPGAVVFMPRNVPHTFQNVGTGESRIVIVITPGRLQAFFEEAGARRLAAPADEAAITALARRYGIKVLGPPPGAAAERR